MLTVLSSSSWSICLIGYAMMGLGQAPIVPIAFSRAGAIKGVSTARATSLVSLLAYAGLLFAPRLRPFCRTLRAAHRPLRRTGSSDDHGFASFPARASYQTLSRRHPSGRILTSSKRPSIIVATTGHALDFGASKLRRRLSWPLLNPQAGMLFSSSPSLGSFPQQMDLHHGNQTGA